MSDDAKEAIGVVLLLAAWIAFMHAIAGCSQRPAPMTASQSATVRDNSTHCLVAVAVVADQETDLELCSSTAAACVWFYAAAVELGYPVLSVGECEER